MEIVGQHNVQQEGGGESLRTCVNYFMGKGL